MILGDSAENNMTAKLIKDGSDTRRAKLNLSSIFIGAVLLLMGIGCIIIQASPSASCSFFAACFLS